MTQHTDEISTAFSFRRLFDLHDHKISVSPLSTFWKPSRMFVKYRVAHKSLATVVHWMNFMCQVTSASLCIRR